MKVYVNGAFVEQEDAKISVFDHGLLYGDGVFEGIRLYSGNIFKLEEHLVRLERSAHAIELELPATREELRELVCEACRLNGLSNGYIRLVVTRGVGSLGLAPWECGEPGLIVIADSIALYPEQFYTEGLRLVTVATRRVASAALPPMVKSLNYLNNILAKIEARQAGCPEALLLNEEGKVAECSGDNLFLFQEGKLFTPPIGAGSLRGITRGAVMDIAAEMGLPVHETDLTRYDVWVAEECFATGTAAEVIPVVEVDGRRIGTGLPGERTQRILEKFKELAVREGTRI